jgi:hypothetical protein
MPVVVLLNRSKAGYFLKLSPEPEESWTEGAFIYQMSNYIYKKFKNNLTFHLYLRCLEPDEYFYKAISSVRLIHTG